MSRPLLLDAPEFTLSGWYTCSVRGLCQNFFQRGALDLILDVRILAVLFLLPRSAYRIHTRLINTSRAYFLGDIFLVSNDELFSRFSKLFFC